MKWVALVGIGNWTNNGTYYGFNNISKSGNYLYAMQWDSPLEGGIGIYGVCPYAVWPLGSN